MRRVVFILALAGLTAPALAAQRTPDFSGTYVMQPSARPSGGMGGGGAAAVGGGGATAAGGGGGATAAASAGARRNAGGGGGSMMGTGAPPEITVSQTSAALTVERRVGETTQTTVYKLDGTESVNSTGNVTSRSRSRWVGATLVTEGTQTVKTSQGEVTGTFKEVRSMDAQGQLVVDVTRQTAGGQAITSQQIFKKK